MSSQPDASPALRPATVVVASARPPHEPDNPLNHPVTMASTYVAGGDRVAYVFVLALPGVIHPLEILDQISLGLEEDVLVRVEVGEAELNGHPGGLDPRVGG